LSLLYRLNTSPIPAEELEFALETVANNLTARFPIRIAQSLIIELVKQYINLNPPVHADEAIDEVASDGAKSYHMSSNEEDAAQAKAILSSHLDIIPNSEAAAKALRKVSKIPLSFITSHRSSLIIADPLVPLG